MINKILLILCLLLLPVADGYSATYTAATCSDSAVQAAINSASTGDTVAIPAGTCTWNTGVSVTKNILIDGHGQDTIITSGGPVLFAYSIASSSATDTFGLSNMAWNMNGSSNYAATFESASYSVQQQISVHDLTITNATSAFSHVGLFKGVIYKNNITTSYQLQQNVGPGDDGLGAWNAIQKCSANNVGCTHDDGRALYWEDNVLNIGDTILESGGAGFSWVCRYNTINYNITQPAFDWHGNYPPSNNRCSTMDIALYGNYLDPTLYSSVKDPYIQARGGMAMIFYNYANDSGGNSLAAFFQDEYGDSSGACSATTNPQSQNISDTYMWTNLVPGVSFPSYVDEDATGEIAENTDYHLQRTGTFNATGGSTSGGGVGAGTLANRPATCTVGVGYWATNQSTSDLSGMVGANPSTPISGTLYKCTSTNTWTAYYTPYTYPHPLREEPTPTPTPTPVSHAISGGKLTGATIK